MDTDTNEKSVFEQTLMMLNEYVGVSNYTLVGSAAAKMHGLDVGVHTVDAYVPMHIMSNLWKLNPTNLGIYVSRPEFEASVDGVFCGLVMVIRSRTLLNVVLSRPCDLNGQPVPHLNTIIRKYGQTPTRFPTREDFSSLLKLKGREKDLRRAALLDAQ